MSKVRGGVGQVGSGGSPSGPTETEGPHQAPTIRPNDPGATAERVRSQTQQLRAQSQPAGGPNPPSPLLAVLAGPGGGDVPRKMVGFVEVDGGHAFLRPLDGSDRRPISGAKGAPAAGSVVEVVTKPGSPQVSLTPQGELAAAGSAKAKLYGILEKHKIDPSFPPAVEAEVKEILKDPGLDDPQLEDLTHLPFITIDNADSRDLDQAMYIERTAGGGYKVFYALADAAHYVRPGTALYEEAMKRGVTLYLPGMAVPMLPPELSEGIVSLNPNEDRRALTMVTELDAQGNVLNNELRRTKINSREKLTYEGVQDMHDEVAAGRDGHPHLGQDFTETLMLLKEVGEKRIAHASERDVARINRREVRHGIDKDDPTRFATYSRDRAGTEKWNEQISLLCNAEGALLMEAPGNGPDVTPIYKVHPEPVKKRLEDFRRTARAAGEAHGLDLKVWGWHKGEPLSDYLARLPEGGRQAGLTAAIHRQSVMVNQASEFSVEPGKHHGVGVEPYARFSSPMREMVGIYTHKEALEKFGWVEPEMWPHADDPFANQAMVVDLANQTKKLQRQIEKDADRLVLDQQLENNLERPFEDRPIWHGTVLGLSGKKAYIQMKDPPFEVKVYLADLAERFHTDLSVGDDRAVAKSADPDELPDIRLGDQLDLKLDRYDAERQRYIFTPVDANGRVLGTKA